MGELDRELILVRARQRKAETEFADYSKRKATLDASLDQLRAQEQSIPCDARLVREAGRNVRDVASDGRRSRSARTGSTCSRSLLTNLEQQEDTLQEADTAAQVLSKDFTVFVTDLKALRETADQMVQASRDDLRKILAVLAAENRHRCSDDWLESSVAAKAKAALAELHIDAVDYALWLVNQWDKGRSFLENPTEAVKNRDGEEDRPPRSRQRDPRAS